MEYPQGKLKLGQLLLDPNNYRFLDLKEYVFADRARYHEDGVQERAQRLVELDGQDELRALKESIEANGYVPIEALVVRPYPHQEGKYVVVEGNRRVAAMRWLQKDSKSGGVSVSRELLKSFGQLPVVIIDPDVAGYERLQRVLMGLRHVSGTKEWGGYQRAKLVVELVEREELSISDAAKSIGMSSYEAKRRYRASKALDQMQQDEEFGSYATPRMYILFHEAVAQPKIREWLGWDEDRFEFANDENRHEFYRLLIPRRLEDDEEAPRPAEPKVRTYLNVRNLKEVIGNVEAEESLLDPTQPFTDALAISKAAASSNWVPRLKAAIQALNRIPVATMRRLTKSEIQPMLELYSSLKERLEDWKNLTSESLEL